MSSSLPEALAELLGRRGAHTAEGADGRVVAGFGDPVAERRALTDGCALLAGETMDGRRMTGADRHRFLNGLVTCDVKALESGRSAYGLVTNREGRVLADLSVLALDEEIWLELPAGRGEEVAQHLLRYRVADRVEIEPLPELRLPLVGPAAPRALAELTGEAPPATREHREVTIGGVSARLDRRSWLGFDAHFLWAAEAAAEPLASALLAHPAVQPVGAAAFEAERVARGAPRYGVDYREDCFPQETGLEAQTVSYTKGCYLGQEVVARIHYRGGVQRGPARVRSKQALARGGELLLDGRPVGRLGSVVATAAGEWIGLAILHQRGAAPGTELALADGGTAIVEELPAPA